MSADFKEKNSGFGKGFLIAFVIVSSSLSFTLGYFVGKIGREEKAASQPVAVPPREALAARSPSQEPAKTAEVEKSAVEEERGTPQQNPPPAIESNAAPSAQALPGPEAKRPPAKERPAAAQQAGAEKQQKALRDESAARDGSSVRGQKNVSKYTVQLGALKSAAEARRMKAKLAKRGYRPYIRVAKESKDHIKIYKVRAGEFEDRREAEVLAARINKAEGLKSFVTAID